MGWWDTLYFQCRVCKVKGQDRQSTDCANTIVTFRILSQVLVSMLHIAGLEVSRGISVKGDTHKNS